MYYQRTFDLDTTKDSILEAFAFATGGEHHDYAPTLNPYFSENDSGLGAITTLSTENPIYRIGGGAGAAINFRNILGPTNLSIGYLAGPDAADPSESNGLFNGNYAILAQITGNITDWFSLAFTYSHGYHPPGSAIFDGGRRTGSLDSEGNLVPGGGIVGTAVANTPSANLRGQQQVGSPGGPNAGEPLFVCNPVTCGQIPGNPTLGEATDIPLTDPVGVVPTVTNAYGLEASFRVSEKFVINAFGSYIDAILVGQGGADIWTYGLGMAWLDLGKEGSVLGLFGGTQPYAGQVFGQGQRIGVDKVPYQAELFYKYPIFLSESLKMTLTPAFIWLTAPNQNINRTDRDALIGLLRTTFTF